jgi:exopolysaccharide biosynthesis polyprenyl glycosylphosphotransferase
MFSRQHRVAAALYILGDALTVLASCGLAYYVRLQLFAHERAHALFPARSYLWLVPVVILIWIVTGSAAGIYREIQEEAWRSILWDPFRASLIATLILFAVTYAVKGEYISRLLIGAFAVTVLAGLISFRLLVRAFGGALREAFGGVRHFLVVGDTPEAIEIAGELEANQKRGLKLAGFAVVTHMGAETAHLDQSRLDRTYPVHALSDIPDLLRSHVIDEVIFAVAREDLERLEETFLACEEEGVKTRVLLSFFPHVISRVYLERLREMPLLTFSTTPENDFLLLLKRTADLVMAVTLMAALSPLMLLLALAVKLTSRGTILYCQTRCGLGGRKFTLYKFRSMNPEADLQQHELQALNELDGPAFKMRDDPRCTPLGRFMRRFSLDELPQLINILQGDMSFVGPRPPLPEEVLHYERWQRRRLRMKPGLTCLWALEGRNRLNFRRWMELDLEYIDTWSPALDWKILLKTIPVVLLGRGAS